MSRQIKSRVVYENLDTGYVNLAALLRSLQERKFTGRVCVKLDDYEAEIFLRASDAPRVLETNRATGRREESEAALQRVLVRAREAGGVISVYEETVSDAAGNAHAHDAPSRGANVDAATMTEGRAFARSFEGAHMLSEESHVASAADDTADWDEALRVSLEVIAAVERAGASLGAEEFAARFRQTCLALADDYTFLDRFEYKSGGAIQLRGKRPAARIYVAGISECLRRMVERFATEAHAGGSSMRIRERVALELAVMARRKRTALDATGFTWQLDRIAGTRVL
jgi:hypothetical protein